MVCRRLATWQILVVAPLALLAFVPLADAKAKGPKIKGPLFNVTLTEYDIEMPESFKHGWVTLRITNTGLVPHGLASQDDKKARALTADIAPGQTVLVPVKLRKGTFMVWCSNKPHADAGMQAVAYVH